MKKSLKPLVLLLFAGGLSSCEKDRPTSIVDDGAVINPIANFEVIKDPSDGFSFSFKNLSSKYEKLEWRFGDDTLSTEASPSHVYLSTGKYQVDMKAFSSTGAVTRKLVDINIDPDSVAKITAVKTGVLNQVKFKADVKAKIKTIEWTFLDVTPNVKSNELEPLRTYLADSFNAFTVKIVTDKGSVINLSKYATTAGIPEEITQKYVKFSASTDNSNTNENAVKLVDNNVDTKIYLGGPALPLTFKFQYASPQTVKVYAIGNGNDSPDRDPKAFSLEGSDDDSNWTVVDSRLNTKTLYEQAGNKYKQLFYFAVAEPKPFVYYRLKISSIWNGGSFQISEIRLFK
jgi:hypothetical protein